MLSKARCLGLYPTCKSLYFWMQEIAQSAISLCQFHALKTCGVVSDVCVSTFWLLQAGAISGQVVDIGLHSTQMINSDKYPIIVPNSFFSSEVKCKVQYCGVL
jgi:hypothetical protein